MVVSCRGTEMLSLHGLANIRCSSLRVPHTDVLEAGQESALIKHAFWPLSRCSRLPCLFDLFAITAALSGIALGEIRPFPWITGPKRRSAAWYGGP